MSLHVLLEAVVTDVDMNTRRWQSFVSDFEPWNSIHDVMHYHDGVINDPEHKIVKVWGARQMQSTRNKIILKTRGGDIELEKKLDMALVLPYSLNNHNEIINIKFMLDIDCTLDDIEAATEVSLPTPESSSNSFTLLTENEGSAHGCEELGLPERHMEQHDKDRVHNALIDYFVDKQISLITHVSSEERNRAWELLVQILWKLNEVGIKRSEWKQKPPNDLDLFLLDPPDGVDRERKRRPSLTQKILSDFIRSVKELQAQDWFQDTSNLMPTFLDALLTSFEAQLDSCVNQAQRMSTLRVKRAYQAIWSDP